MEKFRVVPRFTQFTKKAIVVGALIIVSGSSVMTTTSLITGNPVHAATEQELSPDGDFTRVAPATVNVTLHKGMTEQTPADAKSNNISASATKNGKQGSITADGETQNWNNDTENYNPALYGKVGYTAYDITAVAKDVTTDGIKAIGASIQASQAAGKLADNEYIKGATKKTAEQFMTTTNTTTFQNLAASDDTSEHHVWAFVETTHAKGLVTQISAPIVAALPLTNKAGDKFQTDSQLYPKNIVQKLTFSLIKHGDSPSGDGKTTFLPGVAFQLYKGKPGSGTPTGTQVTTDDNGKLTVSGLTVGSYYFVEVASGDVADIDADQEGTYLMGADARNDSANKLNFTITAAGVDSTTLHADVMNYHAPDMHKTLEASDTNFNSSFTEGTLASFKTTIHTPNDIKGGKGSEIGGESYITEPYGVFQGSDTADEGLTWVRSESDFQAVEPDGTVLKEGTDYTLTDKDNGRGYDIQFIREDGKVSDTVAKYQGQEITLTYKMVVDNDAIIDKALYNTFDLAYQNHPTNIGHQHVRHIIHKVPVYTYGAKFVKKSTGLFGTGVADTKLQGAQYVVQNSDGKYFNGFADGADDDSTAEAQWVDKLSDVKEGVLTSGEDGSFEIKGLHTGDYVLHEIKAPKDYQRNTKDLKFRVEKGTYTNTVYTARDDAKTILPVTGSNERTALAVAAVTFVVVAAGATTYVVIKKRKNAAD
jgi:fimbrial isopeptide formation D2 family protein